MLLMIDNYDSFTYNLVQYLGELGRGRARAIATTRITVDEIAALRPDAHRHLARPVHARTRPGISVAVIQRLAGRIPILGVCLGHQCIGAAFGGDIVRAAASCTARRRRSTTTAGRLPRPVEPVRGDALPLAGHRARDAARRASRSRRGPPRARSWACAIASYLLEGVQFHPESILTLEGKQLLQNFLDVSHGSRACTARPSRRSLRRPGTDSCTADGHQTAIAELVARRDLSRGRHGGGRARRSWTATRRRRRSAACWSRCA